MEVSQLHVELLSYTMRPEDAVANAARLCYSSKDILDLRDEEMTRYDRLRLIRKLRSMGHLSPFEHAQFVFGVEGISRACSHQLVRHRIASYSQQSQRYVKLYDPKIIMPKSIDDANWASRVKEAMENVWKLYVELIEAGVPGEDARYVLPNACETKLIVSMNARELLHFFSKRTCNRAQWEIRAMANEMLEACQIVAPNLFENAGPHCVTDGYCPEGKMSCGKIDLVRDVHVNTDVG